MRLKRLLIGLSLTLALLVGWVPNAWATLYGATGSGGIGGHLLILDPLTGAVLTDVGALVNASGQAYGMTGLAFRPSDGALFGSTSNASPTGAARLVRIDPNTAVVTDIGSFTNGSTMSDLAFDAAGTLYAWRAASGHGLYTVNTLTGLATLVGGQTGAFGGGGLTFDGAGVLYNTPDGATSPTPHLNTVNPLNGATVTSVVLSGIATSRTINALDFDGSTLYGSTVDDRLVTIAPNGVITDLGPTAAGIDAIAFQAVPEPSSLALAATGLLLVAARRRRPRA